MVKPVSSKRQLFKASKEQKENEPVSGDLICESDICRRSNGSSSPHVTRGPHSKWLAAECRSAVLSAVELNNEGPPSVAPLKTTTPCRPVMPVSERQQIALLMQMSSPSPPDKGDMQLAHSPRTPSTPSCGGRGVNKRNERGETPLHVASIRGDHERVNQLIAQGADVGATDYAGWSPLHEACNRGFFQVAKLLIRAGADVNAKGLDNDTPLHDACINGHFRIARLLLKYGASIDVLNSRGLTPSDVSRSPRILTLFTQAVAGSRDRLESSEEEDNTDFQGGNEYTMSRRTSPSSRVEEKSSTQPSSPGRVVLRVGIQGFTTPEKQSSQDSKSEAGGENVYEFNCTKDESNSENDASNFDSSQKNSEEAEEKGEKRSRDAEEEEEEVKKKRKKEEPKESGKAAARNSGNNRSGEKTSKQLGRSTLLLNKPQSGDAKASGNSSERKSPLGSASNSPKPSVSGRSSDGEDDCRSDTSSTTSLQKVPPLKIVFSNVGVSEQETSGSQAGKNSNNRAVPYIVNSTPGDEMEPVFEGGKDASTPKDEAASAASGDNNHSSNTAAPAGGNTSVSSSGDKGSASRITRSQRGGGSSSSEDVTQEKEEPKGELEPTCETVPHRKRKIKLKEPEAETVKSTTLSDFPLIANGYETFFKLRKQVEKRHSHLLPVHPKPPDGFADYMMVRGAYHLAGNANAENIPTDAPPPSLDPSLVELFCSQEKERRRLKRQHLIEKEKLVLSIEQEILRVHGRTARALSNQDLPFSVCTILRDEEVYNVITPEQEEKDRNARSRQNGRHFMSWLRDVDDKFDKIKEHMMLRHTNEAESLRAVQLMDWEWALKEHSLCDANVTPKIDESCVPMVPVDASWDSKQFLV